MQKKSIIIIGILEILFLAVGLIINPNILSKFSSVTMFNSDWTVTKIQLIRHYIIIIGIVLIAVMMRFTSKEIITSDSYVKLESAGLYWHLVDIIWIFLFPLFYLIT